MMTIDGWRSRAVLGAALLALAGCSTIGRSVQNEGVPPHFASPKAAAEALVSACKQQDTARLVSLFGEQYRTLVSTGDAADDRSRCERLVKASGEMLRLDPWGDDWAVMVVGADDFPIAVPIVKDAKGWYFDGAAGVAEVHRRHVGADELAAIATLRVWARKGQAPPSDWMGYRFRVVQAPAKAGRTGTSKALLAYPIAYRTTGIKTFVVRPGGEVQEHNLGDDTVTTAAAMTSVDPTGWTKVLD
ncbi:MAG TPA: DUF2950 family protein [Candidatus Binatia bacterium]|nr:DUF2950 family protein [Candidatus Binatia bacterium]